MKYYYKSGMVGGTKKDKDDFYSILKDVEENSYRRITQWNGDYLKTTFTTYDEKTVVYLENMELGIPTSIEFMED